MGGEIISDKKKRFELALSYRRLQHKMRNVFRKYVNLDGLTEIQLLILKILDVHDALSLRELAEYIICSEGQTSLTVEELTDMGLVCRVRSEEDRRRVILTLTKEGAAKLDAITGGGSDYARVMSRVFDLSEEEIDVLIKLNNRLIRNLATEGENNT